MNIFGNIQKRLEQFGSGVYDATHTKEDPTQSYLSKGISNVTGIGMQDPTQSLLFKGVQGGANLFTGAKESLQGIGTQGQSEFDRKKEIAKNFLSQKGYSTDVIENTLSKIDYKPGFGTRLATGLGNRLQEAENTTDRLQKEGFDPLAGKVTAKGLVTAPLSYAGDVVGTAMEPIGAAISPVVQKVIEKTGQTGNVAEVGKWWEGVRQSNPNFADALEGIVNISSVAPLPLAKPIAGAVKQGGIATGKAIASIVPKIPEGISKIGGSVIQVPKKIVRSGVDTLERIKPGVKDMLVDIDPQSKYAVERSTPKEISKIIEDAKNAKIDPRADYQQTPYHKGAEMANKTVNTIDENLKKRQSERMAILENVPMEKVDLNYSRNSLKSELDKLNIENITIDESGKPVVVPKKGRSALLDQNNPQDMQAIKKLGEILRDDVSPLQTMDNIKILQEWLYENKGTIALKGISKKMEGLVSKVQSSLNKTFKDQLPPEYRKVMDSMSEDMQMSQDMKRLFGIGDDGMPVGNKGELIMKRLTNGTTTGGEARILAEKILKKYGIDLIKEARLRQLSMELVGDTRGANLFGAVLSGRKGMMDWAMGKIGDTMVDKESLIKSYAGKGKIVKPKKQPNLYTKPKKNVGNYSNSNTPINTEGSKKVNTPIVKKSSVESKVDGVFPASSKNGSKLEWNPKMKTPQDIFYLDRNGIRQTEFEGKGVAIKGNRTGYTMDEYLKNNGLSKSDFTLLEGTKGEDGLYILNDKGNKKLLNIKSQNVKQSLSKPISSDTIPEGYFKNVFGEIQKLPSNKNGGFLRIGSESKKLTDPLVEEARKYKSGRNMYDVMPYDMREKFDRIGVYSLKHFEDFYKKNITNTKGEITMYRGQSKPGKQVQFNDTKFQGNTDGGVFFTPNKDIAKKYGENIIELKSNKNNTLLYKEAEKLQKMAEKMVSSNIKNGITSKSIIEQMALGRPKAFAEYTKKPFLETGDMFGEQGEMIYYKNFDNK